MAKENGKLITCDRCGKTVFLKCTGEEDTDGGYTRWNTFEEKPENWKCVGVGTDNLDLCPDCYEDYEAMCHNFMEEIEKRKECYTIYDGN